ncbi:lactonase family protein [Sphingomonas sp. ID0503]|uniref:lactonase family protein n=1 Tax=Sphingomonas sp. ID0503 TaxID=3399691 RepID=UPI003AFB4940
MSVSGSSSATVQGFSSLDAGESPLLCVGTYAASGGRGLLPLIRDPEWRVGGPVAAAENSSFGAFDAGRDLAFFVDERNEGRVRIFRRAEPVWMEVAAQPTLGEAPCYLALSPARTRLAVANYGSGSLAVFTLDPATGLPTGEPRLWQGTGQGPDAERQEGPHVHCAVFDGEDRLYAVDLGTDRIFCFGSEGEEPSVAFQTRPGAGPRHLVFHPGLPVAYLVSELASTITVLDRDGPRFAVRSVHRIQPEDFHGDNLGGHLSLDAAGTRLYVSNRGHDSIAVLAIEEDGDLRLLQHAPTHGASPRSFVLLEAERLFVVANEEAQNVAVIALTDDGRLGEVQAVIPVPGAAFPFVVAR